MVSVMVKRSIAVLIFLVFYFTIVINFSNTIISWFNAFIQQNHKMFEFNTTQLTYSYQPVNITTTTTKGNTTETITTTTNTIVAHSQIVTLNFTPFLSFLIYFTIYFLIPIAGPLLFIFSWARGR